MTYTVNDALRVTDSLSLDGDFHYWLREVWKFYIEPARLNVCDTNYDIIGFFRLIRGLCGLYGGFYNVLNDCGWDNIEVFLDLDYDDYMYMLSGMGYSKPSEEFLMEYIDELISEYGWREVRSCFSKAGCDKIFTSLYYASECEDFSLGDDFDDVLDSILNDVTADKMKAYEWLKKILG